MKREDKNFIIEKDNEQSRFSMKYRLPVELDGDNLVGFFEMDEMDARIVNENNEVLFQGEDAVNYIKPVFEEKGQGFDIDSIRETISDFNSMSYDEQMEILPERIKEELEYHDERHEGLFACRVSLKDLEEEVKPKSNMDFSPVF